MSFNEFMHRRNRYRNKPVDFKELSEKQPILKTHLIEKKSGGVTLDFRNPEAVRALTIAVAKEDFQLDLELSLGKFELSEESDLSFSVLFAFFRPFDTAHSSKTKLYSLDWRFNRT